MKTVITAKDQVLVSLSIEELIALANCANEVLHNSTVDEDFPKGSGFRFPDRGVDYG